MRNEIENSNALHCQSFLMKLIKERIKKAESIVGGVIRLEFDFSLYTDQLEPKLRLTAERKRIRHLLGGYHPRDPQGDVNDGRIISNCI